MTRTLKHVVLDIARLPKSARRWILQRLNEEQMRVFKEAHGLVWLEEAVQFKGLHSRHIQALTTAKARNLQAVTPNTCKVPLPTYCKLLAQKSPLYAALILQAANDPWKADFLAQYDTSGTITEALQNAVNHISPKTQEAIYNEWLQSTHFEEHLDG